MTDPLREAPLSFDQWCKAFQSPSQEERQVFAKAAQQLERSPIFRKVVAEVERNAIQRLVDTPVDNTEQLVQAKNLVHGVRALRQAFRVLSEDAEMFSRGSNNQ